MSESSKETTCIVIGDPHFMTKNIPEVEMFIERIEKLAKEKKPDFIVSLGDLLHTHERLHTIALNKAYEFIEKMRNIAPTYSIVGNHDMIGNQQYLSENHWMNGMKEWENTTVVDNIVCDNINGKKFVFAPYVYPGRFEEALDTLEEDSWKDADCIFAHQEFAGCKMGAIVSVEGDKWPLEYPHVVSGHIHSRQIIQENVYYTGSAMQHAFGESEKNIIAYLTFTEGQEGYNREEIDLKLPRKQIVYKTVKDMEGYEAPETEDKIKVTLSGTNEEFKSFKRTKKYKELTGKGLKVVFKPKKISLEDIKNINDTKNDSAEEKITDSTNFNNILRELIEKEDSKYLNNDYKLLFSS